MTYTRRTRQRLNEQEIRKIKTPQQGYLLIRDGDIPGFALRVTANDVRAFTLTYTIEGRQRRLTIGSWPAWTATAARERAKELRRQIDRGEDPLAVKEARRQALTFREVAEEYLTRHAAGKKTGEQDREYLMRDVLPIWGARKAEDIKRRDVIALIEAKAAKAPVAANRLLACIRKVFNWAIGNDVLELESSPCFQVKAPATERKRDRVLSEAEIRQLWGRLDVPPPTDPEEPRLEMSAEVKGVLRLILITAQRPGECCSVEWSEIDRESGWWTMPAHKAKNGLAHRVPLSKLALEQLPEVGESRWIFPSPRGDNPIAVNALSHAVRLNEKYLGIPDVHPHDLRRTAASHMTSKGIPRLTVQRILNHIEQGVTAIYDRYSYDPEKKAALDKWERELRRILGTAQKAKILEMA